MAACAMAAVYGVPVGVIRESVKAFGGWSIVLNM